MTVPGTNVVTRPRAGAAMAAVLLVAVACSNPRPDGSASASPSDAAIASPTTLLSESASPSPSAPTTPLEGRWTAGPVPVEGIKAVMRAFYGVSARVSNNWVKEIGSPSSLTLSLEFTGNTFVQRWQVPGRAMEVGESGTVVMTTVDDGSGNFVLLSIADGSGVDTYTLHFVVENDYLQLHWVSSTEHGTIAAKAMHRLFTIAFYCSTAFTRAP